MATAVLLRDGGSWRVVDADRPGATGPAAASDTKLAPPASELRRLVAAAPNLLAGDPVVARALDAAGVARPRATLAELARSRAAVPSPSVAERRVFLLEEAERALRAVLASPEETVIALAREEERVERARARERSAAASWLSPGSGPLEDHAVAWTRFRDGLDRHHAELTHRAEVAAVAVAPNLASVVGPRVAGRLIAAAGGLAPLARMPAARLQLLGARRRPGAGRGPRFGLLFLAEGLEGLPYDRQGAYARSLAALAVVAARADLATKADVSPRLLARRERRRAELGRRGR